MKTTINNELRVFQVITSAGKQVFCNLEQLNEVIAYLGAITGTFKINHFWNNKAQKITRKHLADMYEANRLTPTFKY